MSMVPLDPPVVEFVECMAVTVIAFAGIAMIMIGALVIGEIMSRRNP